MAGGRPSKLDELNLEQVRKLAVKGWTDKEIADFYDVSEQTVNNWKQRNPQFLESLNIGKDEADRKVERALFERATGYSHPDTHISNFQGQITETPLIKHYPPDPTSMIFWLKNRKRDDWKDRHQVDGEVSIPGLKEFFDLLPKEHGLPKAND